MIAGQPGWGWNSLLPYFIPIRPTTTLAISPLTALASHPKATIDQYVNPTVFVGDGDL
jgi:hypothetical protein